MHILMLTHIGETLGHLVRGLAIADELTKQGHQVEFVASDRARVLLEAWTPRYEHHSVRWGWSHNSCRPDYPPSSFLQGVMQSNYDLLELLSSSRPDLAVGLPGLFTTQVARHLGIPHVSVLHGPYLSPIVTLDHLTETEAAILDFARMILCGGCIDSIFSRLSETLGFPCVTYDEYLGSEVILVPQPGLQIAGLRNIHPYGFIRASFGPPFETKGVDLSEACYFTFGSGNPCDLTRVIEHAAEVFPHVIVTTGQTPLRRVPSNVLSYPFIASRSLAGRVSAVVSHGGIGTVGTFAEFGTPQLIIPTELDQATMAVHAGRFGIARSVGLHSWASEPRLGRRLPDLGDDELEDQLLGLSAWPLRRSPVHCSGAEEIATAITRIGEDGIQHWLASGVTELAEPVPVRP